MGFDDSSSASPESGLGTSHTSLHGSGQESTNEQMINDEMYYEVEPLQPLGICKALYAFDGEYHTILFALDLHPNKFKDNFTVKTCTNRILISATRT